MKLISICVPMFNEQENIQEFYETLMATLEPLNSRYLLEILFINDGSLDGSMTVVRQLKEMDARVKYVDLSRNYGKEIAMAAGFDYAKGDAVITMDADLQHPPSLILEMVELWEQGYQDIYGKRRERKGESWLKKKLSSTYYKVLQKFSKMPVLSGVGDYRLLDRICVDGIKQLRENQRYTKGLYMWVGYRKIEVLFDAEERFAGETKWKVSALVNLAIDGITSNTTFPLRLSSIAGLFISVCSFIYMTYVLLKTIVVGADVSGFPTTIVLILFLGGVQLMSLGIIGEYLGKVFIEVKDRPLYLIQSYSEEELTKG